MKNKLFAWQFLAILFMAVLLPYQAHPQGNPQRIEIVAQRFSFTPNAITLKKGIPAVLVLTSKDVEHGLKFKELNLNIKAKKGQTAELAFTPARAGTFVGQCSVFCGSKHGSMKMTLHVTE